MKGISNILNQKLDDISSDLGEGWGWDSTRVPAILNFEFWSLLFGREPLVIGRPIDIRDRPLVKDKIHDYVFRANVHLSQACASPDEIVILAITELNGVPEFFTRRYSHIKPLELEALAQRLKVTTFFFSMERESVSPLFRSLSFSFRWHSESPTSRCWNKSTSSTSSRKRAS